MYKILHIPTAKEVHDYVWFVDFMSLSKDGKYWKVIDVKDICYNDGSKADKCGVMLFKTKKSAKDYLKGYTHYRLNHSQVLLMYYGDEFTYDTNFKQKINHEFEIIEVDDV